MPKIAALMELPDGRIGVALDRPQTDEGAVTIWTEAERAREIRLAVLAEREACAEAALAEDSFMMLQDFGMQSMCTQVRENVAAAIRNRKD
jgi:hypothetical protein